IPIVVYADFESSLLPVTETSEPNSEMKNRYQKHEPNSYCILVKSTLSEDHLQYYGLTSYPILYRGENAATHFVDELYNISQKVQDLYSYIVPMDNLDAQLQESYDKATVC
ncbi:hypothetical protein, partial [Klebsiella pneumoniae]|uniref:hypothetical protein n=1 Tax=Klebsiella pneumoniae TaxID=573 RepID=UPI001C8F4622